jgi:hypothetical protein
MGVNNKNVPKTSAISELVDSNTFFVVILIKFLILIILFCYFLFLTELTEFSKFTKSVNSEN